jgi:hypothetical protein
LKGLGLQLGVEKSGVEMSFNPVEVPSEVFTFIKLKPDVTFFDLTCVKIDNITFPSHLV